MRAVFFFALALTLSAQQPRRVAITIDDGPVVSQQRDLASFQRISAGLLEAFRAEKVPVTMFVNERQLNIPNERDQRVAVLNQWLDAGLELGNHTYSHPSLNRTPLWRFQDDVIRGEVITRALLEQRGQKLTWFRYPFLHSGETREIHQGIMDFLEQRGYRVAPVTVDYADYSFASAWARMHHANKSDLAEKVKAAYLDQVEKGFAYAEETSKYLYGHEPAQILLIHCNELNAVTLRESIARMRARGYQFITLAEAMADPIYQRPDTFAGSGGSWLSRTATLQNKPLDPAKRVTVPEWVLDLTRLQ